MSQFAAPQLSSLIRDLRVALRVFRRAPGPASIIVITLGFGIGLTSLVFLFADVLLFRPIPYPEPTRLVTLDSNISGPNWVGTSEPELLDLERLESLESVAGFTGVGSVFAASGSQPNEAGSNSSRRVDLIRATASFWQVLGTGPLMGRTFDASEDEPGDNRVAVLSYAFWQSSLAGNTDVIGRDVRFGDDLYRVIGVMPSEFRFPGARVDGWIPLGLNRAEPWGRNNHYLGVVARLAPGKTLEAATSEVRVAAQRAATANPEAYGDSGFRQRLRPTQRVIGGDLRQPAAMVLTAVGMLLLLTCANLVNIQLARGASRLSELSIRTSLGATRGRLVSQLLAESLLLAFGGGAMALAITFAGQSLVRSLLPANTARAEEIGLDLRVLSFTLGTTLLTTLAIGLWPALRSTRRSLAAAGSARHDSGTRFIRSGLVVAQMAVAALLLVGCGLVARSLQELGNVDAGFSAEGVLAVDVVLSESTYETPEKVVDFYRRADEILRALPGVESAGTVARLPLASGLDRWSIEIEGRPVASVGEAPAARVRQVTPGYFESLDIQLVRGRFLELQDHEGAEPVIVINETLAREHWPGDDAMGQRLRVYSDDTPFMRVVGIVQDLRDADLAEAGQGEWYVPHAQAYRSAYYSPSAMTFVVETGLSDPLDLASTVVSRLRELDSETAIFEPADYSSLVAASLTESRFLTAWLALFSLVAMALGAAGLYGVLSYNVTARHRELGVRLGLGAQPAAILRQVMTEGLVLCAGGLVLGTGLGIGLATLARSALFGVAPADPLVLLGTVVILLALSTLVPLPPAVRASRINPAQVLRGE